jgi:6-pyruvoyltetrahydropterin 2'-reductase
MPLTVSESFFSIQGEGRWAGTPAVFLRLAGCNLECPGWSYRAPPTLESTISTSPDGGAIYHKTDVTPGEHLGCDTKLVWRRGDKYEFEDLIAEWEEKGWNHAFAHNDADLIVTGGEPLLHQKQLIEFLPIWEDTACTQFSNAQCQIETNGTIVPDWKLANLVHRWNVSPKLSSAGDPVEKRVNQEAIAWFKQRSIDFTSVGWKFVVTCKADVKEMEAVYLEPNDIWREWVWLMPEGGTRERLRETAPAVVELCKEFGYQYSPRLHIDIWNEATGV